MSFTTQYAVMVNGVIYCHQPAPWMPARPAVFDSKLAALGEAAELEERLRKTTGLTPIITVAHRYCSEWTTQDVTAGIVQRFERDRAAVRGDARGGLVMRNPFRRRRPGRHDVGRLPNGRFVDSDALPRTASSQFVATCYLPISGPIGGPS